MHLKFSFAIMLLAILLILPVSIRAESRNATGAENCDIKFIKIFKEARKNSDYQVVDASARVEGYIGNCSGDKEDVMKLLHESGFTITSSGKDPKRIENLNRHYRQSFVKKLGYEATYDELIFAEKRAGWWPFWYVFTQYEVTLFLNDGKIEDISSYIRSDLPF